MTADLVAQARAAALELRELEYDYPKLADRIKSAALLEALADELERTQTERTRERFDGREANPSKMVEDLKVLDWNRELREENEALLAVARLAEKCRNTDREPDWKRFHEAIAALPPETLKKVQERGE